MSSSAFALIGDTFQARIGIWKCWFFEKRGKPEYPGKNLSEQKREPTTISNQIWHRVRESNPGYIGERWALSPLRHPWSKLARAQLARLWERSVFRPYKTRRVFAELLRIFNLVDITKLPCYPHRRSTTVSLETFTLYCAKTWLCCCV